MRFGEAAQRNVATTQVSGVRSSATAVVNRLISAILRQTSSHRSDRRARVPIPRRELAKNVNYPASSKCISGRSGLIGGVLGAYRFQEATDCTPGRLTATTCPFRSAPVTSDDASKLSQRGEACRSPGRSILDIMQRKHCYRRSVPDGSTTDVDVLSIFALFLLK